MNIERSLSQVNKEGLECSDFSRAVLGGGAVICSAHSFQNVSQKESCSKQNDFFLPHQCPESRQISLEEIRSFAFSFSLSLLFYFWHLVPFIASFTQ